MKKIRLIFDEQQGSTGKIPNPEIWSEMCLFESLLWRLLQLIKVQFEIIRVELYIAIEVL